MLIVQRHRLRDMVTWCEGDATLPISPPGSKWKVGGVKGARSCTTNGILRSFDWSSLALKLNKDELFAQSLKSVASDEEGEEVSFIDCFRQWHNVDYVLAFGLGHSHVGMWDAFEVKFTNPEERNSFI